MPLAFASASHGTIAFGFFNVASDMLLLEQQFFFADRFCEAVVALAERAAGGVDGDRPAPWPSLPGWTIDARAAVGNLHGAIAGVDLGGFIGATYRDFPFPAAAADFKQSPVGARTQARMAELIAPFGRAGQLPLGRPGAGWVELGGYRFTDPQFARLVEYVDYGGYPRYRDEVRPAYVEAMVRALVELGSPWVPAGLG